MLDLFSMFGTKKARKSMKSKSRKSTKKCPAGKVAVRGHRSNSDRRKKGKHVAPMCRASPKKNRKSKSKKNRKSKSRKM